MCENQITIQQLNQKQTIVLNRYQLNQSIGNGRYFIVFEGIDTQYQQSIAIKVESKNTKHSHIEKEYQILKQLDSTNPNFHIPQVLDFGSDDKYFYMITQLLGPNLEQIFNDCQRKFTLFTISKIGQQLISTFKEIHSKQLLYLHLKPSTVLIGRNQSSHQIYLASFGLAQYKRSFQFETSFFSPFSSKNTYNRGLMSEVDDLESLGYLLIYLMKGTLPWMNVVPNASLEKFEKIREIKMNTSFQQLTQDAPQQIKQYFQHISQIQNEDTPNYELLIEVMKQMENEQKLDQLDWIKKQE